MLRKQLVQLMPNLTDKEFNTVMEMTTEDVLYNHTTFGKRTSLTEVLDIARCSVLALRRCDR